MKCHKPWIAWTVLTLIAASGESWAAARVGRRGPTRPSETRRTRAPALQPASAKLEQAKLHHGSGSEAFARGDYELALHHYQAGYEAAPLPGFLINIGHCYRRLGRLGEARRAYQRFLLVAPDSRHRPEVEAVIAAIDEQRHSNEPADDAGTEPAEAPPARGPATPPAAAVAAVPELPARRQRTAGPKRSGHSSPLVLSLAPSTVAAAVRAPEPDALRLEARAPATPEDVRSSGTRTWVWAAVGTAVLASVATVFLLSHRPQAVEEGTLGALRR